MTLVLFLPGSAEEIAAFPLDPRRNRTGDIRHAFVAGLDPGIEYAYRMDGPTSARHRFDSQICLADPFAPALNGRRRWGHRNRQPPDTFRRALIISRDYDWGLDQPINRPLADSIIYELHVRGFTQDASSGVSCSRTFRGLIEKIPYLLDLGITAVELLPVTEFDEFDNDRANPEDGSPLRNLWGYHPLSFFALKSGYAADTGPGEVDEYNPKTAVGSCAR